MDFYAVTRVDLGGMETIIASWYSDYVFIRVL